MIYNDIILLLDVLIISATYFAMLGWFEKVASGRDSSAAIWDKKNVAFKAVAFSHVAFGCCL